MSYRKRKKDFIEHRILLAIDRLTVQTGCVPVVLDVFYHANIKTLQTMKRHIQQMTESGLVKWEKTSCAIWLTKQGKQLVQQLKQEEHLILSMPDNSMIPSGILEGDTLEIQKDFPLCDGVLVAAYVENELTCRRLAVQGAKFRLYTGDVPEENALETPVQKIVGVISRVQRQYCNFSM